MKKIATILAVAAFLGVPVSASAGWSVTQRDVRGADALESILLIDNAKMRAEVQGQPLATIIDAKADRLVIIDNQKKVYGEKRLSEFLAEMQKMLESVKALKSQLPAEIADQIPDPSDSFKMEIKATGQEATIAGFKAAEFITKDGKGNESGTVWLSKDGKMGKLHSELMTLTKVLGNGFAMLNPLISMAQDSGFPVKSHLLQGPSYVDSEIVSIEVKALPAAVFNVPPGYKKSEFNDFMPQQNPAITTVNPGK